MIPFFLFPFFCGKRYTFLLLTSFSGTRLLLSLTSRDLHLLSPLSVQKREFFPPPFLTARAPPSTRRSRLPFFSSLPENHPLSSSYSSIQLTKRGFSLFPQKQFFLSSLRRFHPPPFLVANYLPTSFPFFPPLWGAIFRIFPAHMEISGRTFFSSPFSEE